MIDETRARDLLIAQLWRNKGGAYGYVWTYPGKVSTWTPAPRLPNKLPQDTNVYFGIHPCASIPPTNDKGEKAEPKYVRSQIAYIASINCLFSEFDCSKGATLEEIQNLDPLPSVVIASGGGWHCYWLLKDTYSLDTPEARARAQAAQWGWVKYIGGDPVAKDLARVLRVPGSLNYKYDPPRPVHFIVSEFDRVYSLEELEARIPPEPKGEELPSRESSYTPGESAEYWLSKALERGTPGNRNDTGFWLACQLRDAEVSESEAKSVLLSYASRVQQPSGMEPYTPDHARASLASAYGGARRDPAKSQTLTISGNGYHPAPEPPANFEYEGEVIDTCIDDCGGLVENLCPMGHIPDSVTNVTPLPESENVRNCAQERKTRWTLEELLQRVFPEPEWIVPELLPAGLAFLAGRPKLGKSWLALQLAHAKGTGGQFLGVRVSKCGVLYIALEDSPRRLQSRAARQGIPGNATITFETTWQPLAGEGMHMLEGELARGEYQLVIIDTFSRAIGGADQLDLAQMTQIVGHLQQLAQYYNVCILLIDHHRKNGGQDANVIDDLMGSSGKAATADAILGLYREQGKRGATLKLTGRDIEEQELSLAWDGLTCAWINQGEAQAVRADEIRVSTLEAMSELCELGEPATTTRIAKQSGEPVGSVSRALAKLLEEGKVIKSAKVGKEQPYALSDVLK